MPHINIEYSKSVSKNCSIQQLLKKIHMVLSKQETIKLQSIKSRATAFEDVIIGDGESNEFVHINILLLTGRSDKLKQVIAQCLFDEAQSFLDDDKIKVSVNVAELGAYAK